MAEITGNPEHLSRGADVLANHGFGDVQSGLSAHGARGVAAAGHPGVAAALSGFTSTAADMASRFGVVAGTSGECARAASTGYHDLSADVHTQSGG